MSLILYPTRVGMDRENLALSTGQPMPKIAHVVVGSGMPHADPAAATALVNPRAESVQLAITRLSDTAIQINAGIDKAGCYTITEVGLMLADGTLYAYGPLMPPHGMHKGENIAIELPCVLSRAHLCDLEVDWSILDINELAHTVKELALDALLHDACQLLTCQLDPLEHALKHAWEYGAQHFEMELFSPRFTLRDSAPIAISGVVAGDDSLDLAEHTDTLTSGDYVIFNASHAEPVRILANLELGRRRVVNNLQYTYPNATLARSNWTFESCQNAVCPAGGLYFTRVLKLGTGLAPHRVYLRALTAAGAPELAWRDENGEYTHVPVIETRLVDSQWSDYIYAVPAHDRICLRVRTPVATRVHCLVACNTLVFSASGNCADCVTHSELDIQQHNLRTMDYFLAQI
ncbi:hypothetical protein [Rivihabitans pingtungensis]|uniref:Uncharacterized protein n=1 Tax=Rivihabitans pingtungensis TaxID=1054498 RepID=A0A318L099_9NEIS|nr:hypothetical protein [Rivihabitans pingtungensis]PXX81375.1 hypothetical protein DFR34_102215 [Rivihabitans pingtungensis]